VKLSADEILTILEKRGTQKYMMDEIWWILESKTCKKCDSYWNLYTLLLSTDSYNASTFITQLRALNP